MNDSRFKLLFVQAKNLVDFEFDFLALVQSFKGQALQARLVKEDVVAEVIRLNEAELSIFDKLCDDSNAHGI